MQKMFGCEMFGSKLFTLATTQQQHKRGLGTDREGQFHLCIEELELYLTVSISFVCVNYLRKKNPTICCAKVLMLPSNVIQLSLANSYWIPV